MSGCRLKFLSVALPSVSFALLNASEVAAKDNPDGFTSADWEVFS